ncbi:MAG TPA: Nif3-like dinuclear metal center hexameric protein [Gemmatirosa sp.]
MTRARGPAVSTLDALATFLHDVLGAAAYPPAERGGVFRPARDTRDPVSRPIDRFGLALEPWPGLRAWAADATLDAVFLHRPWRLAPGDLAPSVGVLYSHLPFDAHLTTGDNAPLAAALGFLSRRRFGARDGRPLGMLGDVRPERAADLVARVVAEFGGDDAVVLPDPERVVSRVAVVGAMTDALVREAAERGAELYVTGQLRAPARDAVTATRIAVAAVGHARSEQWGLRALARLFRERWGALDVRVAPPFPARG